MSERESLALQICLLKCCVLGRMALEHLCRNNGQGWQGTACTCLEALVFPTLIDHFCGERQTRDELPLHSAFSMLTRSPTGYFHGPRRKQQLLPNSLKQKSTTFLTGNLGIVTTYNVATPLHFTSTRNLPIESFIPCPHPLLSHHLRQPEPSSRHLQTPRQQEQAPSWQASPWKPPRRSLQRWCLRVHSWLRLQ